MALTSIPSKTALSLGAVLTDTRPTEDNELSAVHIEGIKTAVIQLATDVGIDGTPAAGSIKARLDDLEAGGGGGSGDVTGPASSLDNAVPRFDGTGGKTLQGSLFVIDDSGNVTASGLIRGRDVAADGSKLDGIEAGADVTDASNVAAAGAIMDSDFAGDDTVGMLIRTDTATYRVIKSKYDGVAAPTGGDDDIAGYEPGSVWIDTVGQQAYVCVDATSGLAEWVSSGGDPVNATTVAAAGAVMDSDFAGSATGRMRRTGAGAYVVIKDTYTSSGPPTVDDDSGDGYVLGSLWINSDFGDSSAFVCADATVGAAVWLQIGGAGAAGDVIGPASSTDNAIARFDATSGKVLQNSAVTIDDSGNIATSGTVDGRDLSVDGTKLDGIEAGADVTATSGALMDDDFAGTANGRLVRTADTVYTVLKDTIASDPPDEFNDGPTGGFAVGSMWIDVATDTPYMCVDSSAGAAVWLPLGGGGGSGDVEGPASAVDGSIAVFDGTTGKLLKDGGVSISAGLVDGRDISVDGTKLDGIESGADVTDAANVAAAGAVMTTRTVSTTSPLTGGGALSSNLTLAMPAATASVNGYATSTQIAKLDSLAPVAISTLSGTSMTVADSDHQKVYRCTSGSTVTVSVPTGLTPGVTVEFIQEGAGQVQLVGSGSPPLTLHYPAAFNPYTRSQWSSIVVTIMDSDEAIVRGHLA